MHFALLWISFLKCIVCKTWSQGLVVLQSLHVIKWKPHGLYTLCMMQNTIIAPLSPFQLLTSTCTTRQKLSTLISNDRFRTKESATPIQYAFYFHTYKIDSQSLYWTYQETLLFMPFFTLKTHFIPCINNSSKLFSIYCFTHSTNSYITLMQYDFHLFLFIATITSDNGTTKKGNDAAASSNHQKNTKVEQTNCHGRILSQS